MNNAKFKEEIFNVYSKNFNLVVNRINKKNTSKFELYVCPLCRMHFDRTGLNSVGDNYLTIEHIPPKSVGGTDIILTCKKCNNDHGSKLDSQLDSKIKLDKFPSKFYQAQISASFNLNDGILGNGYVKVDAEGKFNLVIQENRTNPKYHHEFKEVIIDGKKADSLSFSIKGYDKKRANISILRAAYLLAFKKLGYGFMLSRNSDIPRQIIANEELYTNGFYGIFLKGIEEDMEGVYIVLAPKEIVGYCVVLNIDNSKIGVLLPGSDKYSDKIYDRYLSLVNKDINIGISVFPVHDVDYLLNEKHILAPHNNWLKKEYRM